MNPLFPDRAAFSLPAPDHLEERLRDFCNRSGLSFVSLRWEGPRKATMTYGLGGNAYDSIDFEITEQDTEAAERRARDDLLFHEALCTLAKKMVAKRKR